MGKLKQLHIDCAPGVCEASDFQHCPAQYLDGDFDPTTDGDTHGEISTAGKVQN